MRHKRCNRDPSRVWTQQRFQGIFNQVYGRISFPPLHHSGSLSRRNDFKAHLPASNRAAIGLGKNMSLKLFVGQYGVVNS